MFSISDIMIILGFWAIILLPPILISQNVRPSKAVKYRYLGEGFVSRKTASSLAMVATYFTFIFFILFNLYKADNATSLMTVKIEIICGLFFVFLSAASYFKWSKK